MTIIAYYYREALQNQHCVEAIGCTKDDLLYVVHSLYLDVVNGNMRLCENDTLSGCNDSTF